MRNEADFVHSTSSTISSSDSDDEDLQLFGLTRTRLRPTATGTKRYNRTKRLPKWLTDITFDLHTVITLTNAQNTDPINGHVQPSYHTVDANGVAQRTVTPQNINDPNLDEKSKRLLWLGRTLPKRGTDYADTLIHGTGPHN